MPKFDELLRQGEAARLMEDRQALQDVMDAPETRQLMSMLQQSVGGDLEGAARSAMNGSPQALMDAMRKLMDSQEGAQVAQAVKRRLKRS